MNELILTFSGTHQAIAFEAYCHAHGLPGRLIPVPQKISAGCGLCWKCPLDTKYKFMYLQKEKQIEVEKMIEFSFERNSV